MTTARCRSPTTTACRPRARRSIARATRSSRSTLPAGHRRRGARCCAIDDGLARGAPRRPCRTASQALVDALVDGFAVPPVDVRVLAVRPSDVRRRAARAVRARRGAARARASRCGCAPRRRSRWSRSARSCARSCTSCCITSTTSTSSCAETFHTEGFYKRESSLANALFAARRHRRAGPVRRQRRAANRGRIRALPEERCNPPVRPRRARLGAFHHRNRAR